MEYRKTLHGNDCEIAIRGKLTFLDHLAFKSILKTIELKKIQKMTIDMALVEFIDSAALGILLLIRDECEKFHTALVIRHPVGQVKKMFEISKFYDLFTVEDA
jgi:anti-anti-sigma factor